MTPTPPSAAARERPPSLPPVVERDWALYADWCHATGRDPTRLAGTDIAAFLTDLPATTAIQDRRLRNIRRALGHPPTGLPRPRTRVRPRTGPPWLSYADALTALRHEWWPDGVAARRDALIIVLAAHGLTRTQIRHLTPTQVTVFPELVIDGLALTQHRDPALCPACALTRWVQVLDAYRHRSGRDIDELLTTARTYPRARHDCLDPVGEGWRTVPYLLPPVDRHGAITLGAPISGRALTGILARRFIPPAVPNPAEPAVLDHQRSAMGRRPTPAEHNDIADLYDQISDQADALNARIQALLELELPQ